MKFIEQQSVLLDIILLQICQENWYATNKSGLAERGGGRCVWGR